MSENKGLRYNTGKRKWSLVHFKSLEPMIEVMEFGMKKYTREIELSPENLLHLYQNSHLWQQLENVIDVVSISVLSQKDFVVDAITSNFRQNQSAVNVIKQEELEQRVYVPLVTKQKELNLLPLSKKEFENIKSGIELEKVLENKKENVLEKELRTPSIRQKQKDLSSLGELPITVSQKKSTSKNVNQDAKFAAPQHDYTLIIVMKVENSEVYYVEDAITPLACLTIAFQFLKRLLNISGEIRNRQIKISGRDNWKQGFDKKEILESLQRHLAKLFDGEDIDQESGLHHIGHIMCNAMFYSFYMNKDKEANETAD